MFQCLSSTMISSFVFNSGFINKASSVSNVGKVLDISIFLITLLKICNATNSTMDFKCLFNPHMFLKAQLKISNNLNYIAGIASRTGYFMYIVILESLESGILYPGYSYTSFIYRNNSSTITCVARFGAKVGQICHK